MKVNPSTIEYDSGSGNKSLKINKGDKITIFLEYFKNPAEETVLGDRTDINFVGYIREFVVNKEDFTVEIKCDDSMYLLKKSKTQFSTNDISLDTIVKNLVSETIKTTLPFVFNCDFDMNLGKFRTEGFVTVAKIFQEIKDIYKGIYIYFILDSTNTPVLFSGMKYPINDTKLPVKFAYPYQDDKYPIIENNLEYVNFDKTNELIVVGSTTNFNNNNKTTIATINGETTITSQMDENSEDKVQVEADKRELRIDLNIPNLSISDMMELVKRTWNNYPDNGFKGSFTTFFRPSIQPGEKVELTVETGFDNYITETYFVDKVEVSLDESNGLIQEITIGSKVKNNS